MLNCGRFQLDLSEPLIMGILNVTPDSFSDGGHFNQIDNAMAHAEKMLLAGADIIDVGGESSRPNAEYVSPEEEIERVLPILHKLKSFNVPISLDTRRSEVMRIAINDDVVDLINDIQALENDDAALPIVSHSKAGICLMHMQGTPENMQKNPHYNDVTKEVGDYLTLRIKHCINSGINMNRIIVDPGFGFGKTFEHNLTLLRELEFLALRIGYPLLIGLSRKSMLGHITGEKLADQRLGANIAAAIECVSRGASIVRVHDVKETKQALRVWKSING